MKKWQKRSLAILMAGLMTASCAAFGTTAFAEEDDDYEPHEHIWICEDVTPATFKNPGKAHWACDECVVVKDTPIAQLKSVSIPKVSYEYTGKAIRPKVTVRDVEGTIIDREEYKLTYSKNTNIGTASVKLSFDDVSYLYEGTATRTYEIYMVSPTVVNADKGFKITWKKQPRATGYEVWRSADNGKTYVKAKTLKGSNATTFTNTNDAANVNGRKYKYKIRPVMPGNTGFSRVKTCYKVARPTIKTISNTRKGIKLTWAKNSKATGYQIWRSDNGGKSYIKAKTISNPSTTSFTNTAAAANKNGKKYYYKMRSYKTVNGITYYSTYSPVKTIVRKK